MSADTDNLFETGGVHHVSLGRWPHDVSPVEVTFIRARRDAARSGVLQTLDGELDHLTKDFNPLDHPRVPKGRPGGGRFMAAVLDVVTSAPDPRGESRAHSLYGGGLDSLFGAHDLVPVPWRQMARRKDRKDYDSDLVIAALQAPPELRLVDPRGLVASQPSVTKAGTDFYMNDPGFRELGRTFEAGSKSGNRYPFVYLREDGQDLILAGHHRATAALLKGEPFEAIVISGPWGGAR